MQLNKYPIGQQDFPSIIREGKVYVDKTMHALRIIQSSKSNFLSKPRRFGKSLFISTLESIFLGKKELFKGLYIYDRWKFEEYPIIRMAFNTLAYEKNNLENANEATLTDIGASYDIILEKNTVKDKFKELIQKLNQKYDKGVVILIDEYDKPIIDFLSCIENY